MRVRIGGSELDCCSRLVTERSRLLLRSKMLPTMIGINHEKSRSVFTVLCVNAPQTRQHLLPGM